MSSSPTETSAVRTSRTTRRAWLGLAALSLPTALLALDMSVLYLALPHLATALSTSAAQELWILDIYPFMIAGFLVPMGSLGDRIGRRRLLVAGAAVFAAISVVAALSVTPEMLIAARAALGVAGATLMPSTLALISVMFPDPDRRRVAIAVWTSAFMTGFATGPLIGGALLEVFWWGSVFLLAVPVMGLLLVLGPILLPEHRPTHAGRFDLPSALLFLVAALPLAYGLKRLANDGVHVGAVVAVGLGLAAGAVFGYRQFRVTDPLLDLRMLANRTLGSALLLLLLGPAVVSGITLFVPQYLQLAHGMSPLLAGALILPAASGLIVGAMLAPLAARRLAPGTVIAVGLAVSCAGFLLIVQGAPLAPVWVVVGLVAVYLGSGPFDALGTDLVVGAAPPERAGSAGATSETVTELGGAVGIATLGSLGSAVYQRHAADTLPSDLPSGAESAARESLSGAVAAAERLDPTQAAALHDLAGRAFTDGLQAAGLAGAAITAVLAILAAWLLRAVR
ncbi:MFS transporter [Spiractinospora alimapuensis]|uniref:MFS transporter n=1 Tax=Spiractinospora alimapuensis TaxID=2820884 RepID=UPI001F2CD9ED|nr:MFS transporter [Spiractinospora alimapuensis]